MLVEYKKLAEIPLVDLRAAFGEQPLFVTISPNPKMKHAVSKWDGRKRVNVKMPYDMLPQKVQYDYCVKILRSAYVNYSLQSTMFVTWELNKSANVHLHMIFSDPNIVSDLDLKMFRRDVMNDPNVFLNLASKIDYMNSIVRVNDSIEERLEYLMKDSKEAERHLERMPYLFIN